MRTNNFAVFVIFFGLSLIAALRAHSWGMALLWMAFGVFFLVADAREHHAARHDKEAR
jgi:hypothetical protein